MSENEPPSPTEFSYGNDVDDGTLAYLHDPEKDDTLASDEYDTDLELPEVVTKSKSVYYWNVNNNLFLK